MRSTPAVHEETNRNSILKTIKKQLVTELTEEGVEKMGNKEFWKHIIKLLDNNKKHLQELKQFKE